MHAANFSWQLLREDGAVAQRDIVILGSTGSIGTQALDIVRAQPGPVPGGRADRGWRQPRPVRRSRSRSSGRRTPGWARTPRPRPRGARATWCSTASPVRSACVPTLAALDAGSTLALANKESLIIGGPLVARRAPSPARSCRSTPSTARSPSACAAAAPRRYAGWCSPRAAGRSAAAAASRPARGDGRARRSPTRPGTWAR